MLLDNRGKHSLAARIGPRASGCGWAFRHLRRLEQGTDRDSIANYRKCLQLLSLELTPAPCRFAVPRFRLKRLRTRNISCFLNLLRPGLTPAALAHKIESVDWPS